MRVIAVLQYKGGAGKTTLSINLAHALARDGSKVLLVDGDPQGSARDWSAQNGGSLLPVVGLDRETLPSDLNAISHGYDWAVIDGAPHSRKLATAAIKAADLVLIPVQPSPYDLWASVDLVETLKTRQEITDGKPLAAFVISRAIRKSRLERNITEVLQDLGLPLLEAGTTQRVAYPTTAAAGQTAFRDPNGEAAQEIEAIAQEVKKILGA